MATRKSSATERDLSLVADIAAEATPRARARKRHDAPHCAPATAPVSNGRPTLRLVKPSRTARSSDAPSATPATPAIPAATSGRAAAVAATPVAVAQGRPREAQRTLLALPSTFSAPVAHTPPPVPARRPHVAASTAKATVATHPARLAPAPQPPHTAPRTSVRARFGELREALADGFEIVQPIFARPLWSVSDDSATAFNFVLRRELTTRLVTVPEGRTIQRFIRERQLLVDYRR